MNRAYRGQKNKNKGMTLIEMVVSFALLSLFISAAAVVIFNVTNLYYHVRRRLRNLAECMYGRRGVRGQGPRH